MYIYIHTHTFKHLNLSVTKLTIIPIRSGWESFVDLEFLNPSQRIWRASK